MTKFCLVRSGIIVATAITVFVISSLATTPPAQAETTECTQISALPIIITVQGVYCLKSDLVTGIASGDAIEIRTNNVTIDLNGWKLGGLAGGTGTDANGIYAMNRKNITIRNGSVRGFAYGIFMEGASGSGHLIEHVKSDGNRIIGLWVEGNNSVVQNNSVVNTGGHDTSFIAYGIRVGSGAGISVRENAIGSMSGVNFAEGIVVEDVNGGTIRRNMISGLESGAVITGIAVDSSNNVVISGNVLNNATTGTTGIEVTNGNGAIDCIDNGITGYTTAVGSCDYTAGNYTP